MEAITQFSYIVMVKFVNVFYTSDAEGCYRYYDKQNSSGFLIRCEAMHLFGFSFSTHASNVRVIWCIDLKKATSEKIRSNTR